MSAYGSQVSGLTIRVLALVEMSARSMSVRCISTKCVTRCSYAKDEEDKYAFIYNLDS